MDWERSKDMDGLLVYKESREYRIGWVCGFYACRCEDARYGGGSTATPQFQRWGAQQTADFYRGLFMVWVFASAALGSSRRRRAMAKG